MDNIASSTAPIADTALRLARYSLIATSSASAIGFNIAHRSTSFGFSVARLFATPIATLVDLSLGTSPGVGSSVPGAVETTLSALLSTSEFFAQSGISLGEAITGANLQASTSAISYLSDSAGVGNEEALRALSAFWTLVQREYNESLPTDPEGEGGLGRWSVVEVFKAAACWAALQGVTKGKDVRKELQEIPLVLHEQDLQEGEVLWDVMSEEVGEEGEEVTTASVSGLEDASASLEEGQEDEAVTRANLKRFSKLALGSYGGMGAIFFGVKLAPSQIVSTQEGGAITPAASSTPSSTEEDADCEPAAALPPQAALGFWGLLSGKHDEEVLAALGGSPPEPDVSSTLPPTRKRIRRPPKFFVIADHPTKTILLLLRGTMSIDDVATDLACEAFPIQLDGQDHLVHGGMWEIAASIGGSDGTVTHAVKRALDANPGYSLCLTGHSLGAGVAALLAIIWAKPESCKSRPGVGLPVDRKVRCYGFAPPCTMDPVLSRRCTRLCHSFVYSTDAVGRFSLGHIKDIRSAAAWLCHSATAHPDASPSEIISRIFAYRRGKLDGELDLGKKLDEENWFESIRATLEANMVYADLFPPGEVWWLTAPGDAGEEAPRDQPTLYKVTGDVAQVFQQMRFTSSMLSSHLPHRYMQVIHDFL